MEKKMLCLLNSFLATGDESLLRELCVAPEEAESPADAGIGFDILDEIFGEVEANEGMDV